MELKKVSLRSAFSKSCSVAFLDPSPAGNPALVIPARDWPLPPTKSNVASVVSTENVSISLHFFSSN